MTWEMETERERGPEAGEMGERRPGGVTLRQQQHQQSWRGWPNWKRPGGVKPVEPAPPSQPTNEEPMNGVHLSCRGAPWSMEEARGAHRTPFQKKLNLAAETVPWKSAGSHIVQPSYESPEPERQAF